MKVNKHLRRAEQEIVQIEMDLMWHEQAMRNRGFSKQAGLMNKEKHEEARERRKQLRNFITESRKKK